ncbi:MAG: type I pullulanase [Oscillospiraceae bacterium]|nr:type I pullulanase [Oscillospiraceae bacterium]
MEQSCHAEKRMLGNRLTKHFARFRVWAPGADSVLVRLYADAHSGQIAGEYPLTQEGDAWSGSVPGDREGQYYTYCIRRGQVLHEVPDPYAHASNANGMRSMLIDLRDTDPEGWDDTAPPALASPVDAVICEVHVRDLSSDESGHFVHRGGYAAFTETDAVNAAGEPIGLPYWKSLGITHLHLLPVLDFASVDEHASSFNWGYDPMQYFIPEGSYASDPDDGRVRIRELKSLILAAHRQGLGVILDVVYNHTYQTERFEALAPGYYYRTDENGYANGSGCGNELASERPMVRRLILDSLCYLAREYRVDGFRFDLMGLTDIRTMRLAERRLRRIRPDILLYGEGWTGGASPLPERRRLVRNNARCLPGIAMFSDDCRDSIRGSVFDDAARGFVCGNTGEVLRIRQVLCGGVYHPQSGRSARDCWALSPAQSVNYIECHDDLTFHDKLCLSMKEPEERTLLQAEYMGAALLLLSQGIPFLQAGQEWMRTKPLPEGGFEHNSYRSPDSVNSLKWDALTQHRDLAAYYRGLLALRRAFPELRLRTASQVRERITMTQPEDGAFLLHAGRLCIAVNPTEQDREYPLTGEVYADAQHAGDTPLYAVDGSAVCRACSVLVVKLS